MCFIVIEGVDGSGKTTASKILARKLRHLTKREVVWCRAPDGPIRNVLLNRPKDTVIDEWTELMLFVACHRWLLINKVIPALKRGAIVVLDRFTDSTIAYQGSGRGLGVGHVNRMVKEQIYDLFGTSIIPDITLYIQISSDIRESRLAMRKKLDYMDLQGLQFRDRIDKTMKLLCEVNQKNYSLGLSKMQAITITNDGGLRHLSDAIKSFLSEHLKQIKETVLISYEDKSSLDQKKMTDELRRKQEYQRLVDAVQEALGPLTKYNTKSHVEQLLSLADQWLWRHPEIKVSPDIWIKLYLHSVSNSSTSQVNLIL